MNKELKKKELEKAFTLFKDKSDKIFTTMSEEYQYKNVKWTKFEKKVSIDSYLDPFQIDDLIKQKKLQFMEELKNDCKIIPLHPQILNLIDYNIAFDKERRKIKYSIYYNEQRLIPLAQYFYIKKESPSEVMNCFYKIGSLFVEL